MLPTMQTAIGVWGYMVIANDGAVCSKQPLHRAVTREVDWFTCAVSCFQVLPVTGEVHWFMCATSSFQVLLNTREVHWFMWATSSFQVLLNTREVHWLTCAISSFQVLRLPFNKMVEENSDETTVLTHVHLRTVKWCRNWWQRCAQSRWIQILEILAINNVATIYQQFRLSWATGQAFISNSDVTWIHIFCFLHIKIRYSKKFKEHVDIMIFIERYPLKRCQGCVKLIASKVICFLNITDLSEVQLCMSSNSWTWECPHTKDGADHVPLIFLSRVNKIK